MQKGPKAEEKTKEGTLKLIETHNTVNIGFCDQPPSGGSRSLNTGLVAIARLDIATRWPLNAEIKT